MEPWLQLNVSQFYKATVNHDPCHSVAVAKEKGVLVAFLTLRTHCAVLQKIAWFFNIFACKDDCSFCSGASIAVQGPNVFNMELISETIVFTLHGFLIMSPFLSCRLKAHVCIPLSAWLMGLFTTFTHFYFKGGLWNSRTLGCHGQIFRSLMHKYTFQHQRQGEIGWNLHSQALFCAW